MQLRLVGLPTLWTCLDVGILAFNDQVAQLLQFKPKPATITLRNRFFVRSEPVGHILAQRRDAGDKPYSSLFSILTRSQLKLPFIFSLQHGHTGH
jgi:hypothetical protein